MVVTSSHRSLKETRLDEYGSIKRNLSMAAVTSVHDDFFAVTITKV